VALYFEPDPAQPFDPTALVAGCLGRGASAVLLDAGACPREFFDLSTGLAGETLQKLTNYRIRLVAVVPDPSIYSVRFREFAGEAKRGRACRFFATREEAIDWLESTEDRPGLRV
jgi:hypothetical protein